MEKNNTMKFIETPNGDIVNVNEIKKIVYELEEDGDFYCSYIYLNDGEKLDFLDIPHHFIINGKEYYPDGDFYNCANRSAMKYILNINSNMIDYMEYYDQALDPLINNLTNLTQPQPSL
jgi:hypothetical protein